MEVSAKKRFVKDLLKIPANFRAKIESFAFEESVVAERIENIPNIKAITGYPGYYRKRFGDYRIGFKIDGNEIIFYRALHRKDIYRYFP